MVKTSGYYTYLISSLPMLHFGMKPPISFQEFLEMCEGIISEEDIDILKTARTIGSSPYDEYQPTLEKWHLFDTALRNELVKIRSVRKHIDPNKYLRHDGYTDIWIAHSVINAYRKPTILESEKALDLERWRFLEELEKGHYFDIDFLIVYAHKLLILEKWDRVNTAEKPRILEESLQKS